METVATLLSRDTLVLALDGLSRLAEDSLIHELETIGSSAYHRQAAHTRRIEAAYADVASVLDQAGR